MNKTTLFSVGPVNMFEYTRITAGKQVPYFRTNEFSNVVLNIENNLKTIMNAKVNSKVALLTASGSGAMEAVVQTLSKNKKSLVINGGSFGDRFDKLLTSHGVPHDTIILNFDCALTKEILEKHDGIEYEALLVNIHETSIGKYYNPQMLKAFCQKNKCYLIIDAISSFLADEFDMTEFCSDVTIISSQKALALDAGLSAVVISDRYYADRVCGNKVSCSYLDLDRHIIDGMRGQTPYTPALNIIYQLDERLKIILDNGGAKSEIERCKKFAEYFRQKVTKVGFKLPNFTLSNCLTPIVCTKENATYIFNLCKDKYKIYVTPSGGINKEKLLRIGHLGNLSFDDYDILLKVLEEANV